ncbi:MAG: hypothetical protein AAF799_17965 [Myxococcota bacterium]
MTYVRLTWMSLCLVVSGGCGPSIVLSDEGGDSSGEGGTSSASGPSTQPMPTTAGTTGQASVDDSGDAVTSSPPPPPPPVPVPDAGADEGPTCVGPLEVGAACADNEECCSGMCFVVGPLGGVCSECLDDDDCDLGCSVPNPLEGVPAVCTDGGIGAGCNTSDACSDGLLCNGIIEVPGILDNSTCGQCITDSDCAPGLECAPQYDLGVLGGFWHCVAPDSQPLLGGCNGPEECASDLCVPADIMGIPVLEVCSECADNGDCNGGSCNIPEVVVQGTALSLEGGFCG